MTSHRRSLSPPSQSSSISTRSSSVIDDALHSIYIYRRLETSDVLHLSNSNVITQDDIASLRHDSSTAIVVRLIEEDPPEPVTIEGILGGFKVIQRNNNQQITFGQDHEHICCVVVTGLLYKRRIAIQLLRELYETLLQELGTDVLKVLLLRKDNFAKEKRVDHNFSQQSRSIMEQIGQRYIFHNNVILKKTPPKEEEKQQAPLLPIISPSSTKTFPCSESHYEEKTLTNQQLIRPSQQLQQQQPRSAMMCRTIGLYAGLIFLVLVAIVPILVGVLKKEEEDEEIMSAAEQNIQVEDLRNGDGSGY